VKEFKIVAGAFHRNRRKRTIAIFYELTYEDAIEAAIEILTLNDKVLIVEIYSRTEDTCILMALQWDSESKRACPLYGRTIIKGLPDRQSVVDYCLKMKNKRTERDDRIGYLPSWEYIDD
jgi:hypothetical protein